MTSKITRFLIIFSKLSSKRFQIVVILVSAALSANVARSNDIPLALKGSEKIIHSLAWGETIEVLLTAETFSDQPLLTSNFKVVKGRKIIAFSTTSLLDLLTKPVTGPTHKQIFSGEIDYPSVTIDLWQTGMIEVYRRRECTFNQIRNSATTLAALSILEGPTRGNVYARVNALEPMFSKLNGVDHCKQLIGTGLFVLAVDPHSYLYKKYYRSWFASAALQSQIGEQCGENEYFIPSDLRQKIFECLEKVDRVPTTVEEKDILIPLIGLAGVFAKQGTPADIVAYYERLLEGGIYIERLPLAFPFTKSLKKDRIQLTVGKEDLGFFPESDLNPLLLALLGSKRCRSLLTLQGVKEYCLIPDAN